MALEFSPLPDSQYHLYFKLVEEACAPGVMGLMYPNGVSPAALENVTAATFRSEARFPSRTYRFKVVDPSLPASDPYEGIVGVSQWRIYPHDCSPEELAEEKAWVEADTAKYGGPEGQNVAMVNDFRGAHAALKEKHLGAKAHVYLHVLATRPGFQRRGVGALSMQWGAEKADALGLLSYVESSAQGVGLYARYGFVEVDVSPFDGRKWGHGDELRVVIMVRSPKGSSSS